MNNSQNVAITPDSDIFLIKLPFEMDNTNHLTFSSLNAQTTWFSGLQKLELDNATYMRKDGVLRWAGSYDDILEYNYCMYKNTHFSNKWFYAYIEDIKFENPNMTSIQLKTDVFQTWQFDIAYKKCFVEREHVNNDTKGLHTIPEGLETGDYISCKLQPSTYARPETCFVVATTEPVLQAHATLNQYLPTGCYYYGLTTLQGIQDVISILDNQGKGDAVVAVFVALKDFFDSWGTSSGIDGQISSSISFQWSTTIEVTQINYLGNDYIPKNKKLLCFPYSFLQVSNHSGQVVNYRWENFNLLEIANEGKVEFSIVGTLTPGLSMKAFPKNYNNILNNNDDTIVVGKYPIGAYSNDVYTNWLTQNGVNIGLNILSSVGQIGGGIGLLASGGGALAGAGTIASGLMGVANTMSSIYEHSLMPDSVSGNVNSGDINFVEGLTNLEFKRMSIKNEYAKIIDDFFSMYGYKVNSLKVPNITGRANWNYVKTIDCNFDGDIPQKDLLEIRSIFNNGATFWHNPTTFLDYSQSNGIV